MTSTHQPGKPIVLVVEDEAMLLMFAQDFLEDAGFDVITARNADDAVRLLELRDDIRVVFTDVQMPGSMDGLKLAYAIRNRWPPIKLIVASGNYPGKTPLLPSDTRYFSKPYEPSKVIEAVQRAVA